MTVESELRVEALERAAYRCEFPDCPITNPKLEMAHLKGKQAGGSRYRNVIENVAILCAEIHHPWLDGAIVPTRRLENEMVLRAALGRQWEGRR